MFDTHAHSLHHGVVPARAFAIKGIYSLIDSYAKQGITKLCLTEHMPLPDTVSDPTPENDCGLTQANIVFLASKAKKIKSYASEKGITVLVGGEYDYFPNTSSFYRKNDTVLRPQIRLLGLHFIDTIATEPFGKQANFCFDFSKQAFEYAFKQKGSVILKRYFELLVEAMQKNSYDIVAHVDLINKYNDDGNYFPEDGWYEKQIKKTLYWMKQKKIALEVNMGGVAFTRRLVPREWIIVWAYRTGIPITIGSDNHGDAGNFTNNWKYTIQLLRNSGVNQIAIPETLL